MAVLGRNGAGKSTLCNVAAGAVELTSGHVVLAGDDVSAQPAFVRARRGLTLVPEARGVFPGLTVEENLRVVLQDRELRDRRTTASRRCVSRRGQVAGLLSGGEQQMLSLAPALAEPPDVLIADEPTLGLAPLVAEVVLEALSDLRAAGTAILLAEEKASEVMKLADVVTVVELGRIAWTRPREVVTEEELVAVYLSVALETEATAATKHAWRRGEEPTPRRRTTSMHRKQFTRESRASHIHPTCRASVQPPGGE